MKYHTCGKALFAHIQFTCTQFVYNHAYTQYMYLQVYYSVLHILWVCAHVSVHVWCLHSVWLDVGRGCVYTPDLRWWGRMRKMGWMYCLIQSHTRMIFFFFLCINIMHPHKMYTCILCTRNLQRVLHVYSATNY